MSRLYKKDVVVIGGSETGAYAVMKQPIDPNHFVIILRPGVSPSKPIPWAEVRQSGSWEETRYTIADVLEITDTTLPELQKAFAFFTH